MVRIYRERVDEKMMEIYDKRPYIRFRDIFTGRYIKRPDRIGVIGISGGITWGGKEPIEVEAIITLWIDLDRLLEEIEEPEDLVRFFSEEGDLWSDLAWDNYQAVRDYFNIWIAETLEFRGRELRQEIEEEKQVIRYRKIRRGGWTKWREIIIPK